MDKVQVVLEYLRKYHFWLLCIVAIGASLMGWSMAKGTLSDEYQKGKSTIEGKFNSLQQIQGDQNPPNDTWKEAIDKLTVQGRGKVKDAWDEVYKEQQEVLKWPEEILGKDFIAWISSHKPGDEIPAPWPETYRNEVVNVEFPKLVEIVDAKLKTEEGKKAPADDINASVRLYKVDWVSASQEEVQRSLMMDPEIIPSSQVVRLRQEDLWVFRALLNIISKTNESAQYSSHIKRINALTIGATAASEFQKGMASNHIEMLQSAGGDGGGQSAASPAAAELGEDAPPDAGRYVGEDGNPLQAGMAATEQFKRLPVYMNLQMNQNEITKFLTHCANYPLPVEVKQLRINPDLQQKEQATKTDRAAGGADDSDGLSMTALGPLDVTVEIHGIIYIYNPPDPAKLGMPGEAEVAVGG